MLANLRKNVFLEPAPDSCYYRSNVSVVAMLGSPNNDLKGLWAVFWRMLLLAPIVAVPGAILFTAVTIGFILPPIYSIGAFINGDWLYGIAALIGWLVLLRFRKPILRWTLEGFEHSSL